VIQRILRANAAIARCASCHTFAEPQHCVFEPSERNQANQGVVYRFLPRKLQELLLEYVDDIDFQMIATRKRSFCPGPMSRSVSYITCPRTGSPVAFCNSVTRHDHRHLHGIHFLACAGMHRAAVLRHLLRLSLQGTMFKHFLAEFSSTSYCLASTGGGSPDAWQVPETLAYGVLCGQTTALGASAERAILRYSGASEFWFEYKLMDSRLYNCLSSHTLFFHTHSLLRPL
jgi:hypothetical protein